MSWRRGAAAIADISDGTSHTYLIGEKRVAPVGYGTNRDWGYDQSPLTGVDIDTTRWTVRPPAPDGPIDQPLERRFGSAHAAGTTMAMCDGSIRLVAYSVDPDLHQSTGNRRDGG